MPKRGIRISDRLPYGTIAKFRSDQGGAGGGVTNKQLVTFARAHGRHTFSTASLTTVATGGERGRRRCGSEHVDSRRVKFASWDARMVSPPLSSAVHFGSPRRSSLLIDFAVLSVSETSQPSSFSGGKWLWGFRHAEHGVVDHQGRPTGAAEVDRITPSVLGEMPHHVAQPIQSSATL